jgi:hypothetical protein
VKAQQRDRRFTFSDELRLTSDIADDFQSGREL